MGVAMSIGKSGRTVIEVASNFKRERHNALGKEGKSLKGWFAENANLFLGDKGQIALSLPEEASDGVQK